MWNRWFNIEFSILIGPVQYSFLLRLSKSDLPQSCTLPKKSTKFFLPVTSTYTRIYLSN